MGHGSATVIGGGIAGLASGIYARTSGHDTTVFEMHTRPGGVCTAWERGGYLFDGCLHWLVGGKPGTPFRRLWDEAGAVDLDLVAGAAARPDGAGRAMTAEARYPAPPSSGR